MPSIKGAETEAKGKEEKTASESVVKETSEETDSAQNKDKTVASKSDDKIDINKKMSQQLSFLVKDNQEDSNSDKK